MVSICGFWVAAVSVFLFCDTKPKTPGNSVMVKSIGPGGPYATVPVTGLDGSTSKTRSAPTKYVKEKIKLRVLASPKDEEGLNSTPIDQPLSVPVPSLLKVATPCTAKDSSAQTFFNLKGRSGSPLIQVEEP